MISPTRAPFDSSTAFVATVVPWRMFLISETSIPASSQIRRTPVSTPSEGSAGVDGVFTRYRAAAVAVAVADEEEVGEGPTDVDPEPVRHPFLPSLAGDRLERAGAIDLSR